MKCAVVGYGSWATTLVRQLSNNGIQVNWLITNSVVSEGVKSTGRNPKYVRDVDLNETNISIFDDINDTVKNASYLLLACPSAYLKTVMDPLTESLDGMTVISAIKGIEPESGLTILEYINRQYGLSFKNLAIISGPTHAEEVSRDSISYLTAAASSEETAGEIANLFRSKSLKIDLSTDIYGIEYSGILKNIYAIMAGIAAGLGYGDNFIAVLVSKAASEISDFLEKSYKFDRDVTARAYLGDLLVTCYSTFSRNRRFGQLIGKGCTVKSALNEMTMIAEGYFSSKLIMDVKSRFNVSMPIVEMAYEILYNNGSARSCFSVLSDSL